MDVASKVNSNGHSDYSEKNARVAARMWGVIDEVQIDVARARTHLLGLLEETDGTLCVPPVDEVMKLLDGAAKLLARFKLSHGHA